ncbi:MAG: zf-HC2 domain-containing protein [Anaerolineae bacterium]
MTNPNTDLTCIELVELITDYLEGSLDSTEKVRFETHLQGCEGCQNYLAQMQTTISLTGKITEDKIAPTALEELLKTFQDWKKPNR